MENNIQPNGSGGNKNIQNLNNMKKKSRKGIAFNGIITLLLIISLFFVFWKLTSVDAKEISYEPTFVTYLSESKVKKVEINSDKIFVTLKDNTRCWFNAPDVAKEAIVAQIEEYNKNNEADVILSFGPTTTISIISVVFPVIIMIVVVIAIFYGIRQIKGTANKSMDFVKSRAKVSTSKIKFSDVAGADEEKEEVREIIDFLRDPEKFTLMGARIPKGILMIGPPGTGKTLIAKAIAGEAEVPFFTISGSDFMELYVGVGASRVRDLFDKAKKSKPCIIFIDEIDAIGRQRGTGMGGGSDEREQTLNELLVQMDGFETNEGIILIAATNRADILDPALMRPGRFDRQVYIHIPDIRGREEILKVHGKNKKFTKDVDFKQIARITSGFTGADIENLLNEAAIIATRQGKKNINMKDISEGIDKVIMGPQKKSRVVTDRDKKITAYHETGHAIVSKFTENSDPIHEISIIPRGGAAGYTVSRPDNDDNFVTKTKLMDKITMMLGGRAAEEAFLKDISTGASNDILRATEIARKMVTEWGMSERVGLVHLGSDGEVFLGKNYQTRTIYSEEQAAIIDSEVKDIMSIAEKRAMDLLLKNKKIVETMVEVLLAKNTIYTDEVDKIIAGESVEEVIAFIDEKLKKEKEEHDNFLKEEKAKEKAKEPKDPINSSVIKVDEKLIEGDFETEDKPLLKPKTKTKAEGKDAAAKTEGKDTTKKHDDEISVSENISDALSVKKAQDNKKKNKE